MDAVRAGQVDCIVVKDLSRFGRNYKETGNYLERIFPYLDVRFVAVSDNFDTLTAERTNDGYIVPLKNLINEVYSRDISRKCSSALATKQHKGEFIGSWAPYGYQKSAADRHKLEVNDETAPVVRNIFAWRRSGMSFVQITRRLNDMGIPAPSKYHYMRGEIKAERFANSIWHVPTIKAILFSPMYLGNMVQGRRRNDIVAGKKDCRVPQSEWIIVPNTHEPIVDEETFRIVQEMREKCRTEHNSKSGKYDSFGTTPNILKGLIFCADCKKPLLRYKNVSVNCGHRYYAYICRSHNENPELCPNKYLLEDKLINVLWDCLQQQIVLAGDMAMLAKQYDRSPESIERMNDLSRQITAAKQTAARYKRLHDSLYQNYVDGLMDELEYAEMKRQYQADAERAQAKVEQLESQQAALKKQTVENTWLRAFSRYSGETELTENMVHALVERIEVDSANGISIRLRYRDQYGELARLLGTEVAV